MPRPTQADKRTELVCPICQKHFSTKEGRQQHVLVVHENAGRLKCSYCDKTFERKDFWERHERIHTKEKPFHCKICQKAFACKPSLRIHHLGIHAKKKFKCKTCGNTYGREYILQRHLQTHSEDAKKWQCEDCPEKFDRRGDLKTHQLESHAEKKFNCDRCGLGFVGEAALQEHFQTHSNNSSKCGLCTAIFYREESLKKHLKGHPRKTSNFNADPDGTEEPKTSDDLDGQTEDDQPSKEPKASKIASIQTEATAFDCYDFNDLIRNNQSRIKEENGTRSDGHSQMITPDWAGPDGELASNAVTAASLKVVFDLEYRAPC